MLTTDLINNTIPQLQLRDTVAKALGLINDFRITHLPVVSEGRFLGLISESDLLDAENGTGTIEGMQSFFLPAAVKENIHFLNAVNYSNQFETSIVPVVNEVNELLGVITIVDLLKMLGNFSGANEIGGIIVMEMERSQFAISEISRIVESNNATVLHLNTTVHPETGLLTVTLHLNKKEIIAIVAAFERYEYNIVFSFSDEKFDDDIDDNYRHFMNYLQM